MKTILSRTAVVVSALRVPCVLLVLVTAFAGRLSAQNPDPVTVSGTIPDRSFVANSGTSAIDLRSHFAVPSITDTVVQFTTPGAGVFNVEMNATVAPNTVANFLSYVIAGRFTNSVIHRSISNAIQGGSFIVNPTTGATSDVVTSAPIPMEAGNTLQNNVGTIAMARSNNLNSATSGWFINVINNSGFYKPASANDPGGVPGNAGSYAVFGRVTGTGMTVVNAIRALPVLGGNVTVTSSSTSTPVVFVASGSVPANFGSGWTLLGATVQSVGIGNLVTLSGNANADIITSTVVPFTLFSDSSPHPFYAWQQLPVFTNLPSANPNLLTVSSLVLESSITAVPLFPATPGGPSVVTFSASSSNPVISTAISGSSLSIGATSNTDATGIVTVTATDSNGNTAQTTFNVTVTPGASAVAAAPPKDNWSQYYNYAATLYNYYGSIGSSDLANAYYYLYYGYAEYNRYKAVGNSKRANASYWWFYASFAYFYYAQSGDYTSANSAYNTYVAYAYQYLR